MILPEYELDGWTTTLPASRYATKIIALYADHGTHAQFQAEFKTGLDLTRMPQGKFDTNALVCRLAALAMNILRLMGQRGFLGPDAPVRHNAKRRRIKTAMQGLIYRPGRLILGRRAGQGGPVERKAMIDRNDELSVKRQSELAGASRRHVHYLARATSGPGPTSS